MLAKGDEVEFGERALIHYPPLPANGGSKGAAGSTWRTLSLTPPPGKLVESHSGVWQVCV